MTLSATDRIVGTDLGTDDQLVTKRTCSAAATDDMADGFAGDFRTHNHVAPR
jgi:hypothetical protein